MTLASGQHLSHYEILGALGAGAMGEVYRARDLRLGREVALKVLPADFVDDEERLRRFEREARALASLNHPAVAQVFGIDQVEDTCFMAMELVSGEDLAARLARGPLPVDDALAVGRQIAEGLEAAHDAGVIHRDLKPANVVLGHDGRVKVLDFGLAKPTGPGVTGESTHDSVLATEAGRLLGTPTYMAPEQARGKPVDKRIDVWAFGCVLSECLTGRRVFDGESLSDVLAAVLEKRPDLSDLPAATPASVRGLIERCLIKDPRRRLRDLGEARLVLENPGATTAAPEGTRSLPWGALAAVLAAAALIVVLATGSPPPSAPTANPVRFRLVRPVDLLFRSSMGEPSPPSVSPDGTRVVMTSFTIGGPAPALFLHTLATDETHALPGTARGDQPFWSPDGELLAWVADGALRRLDLESGRSETIAELPPRTGRADVLGATWSQDGAIVFSFEGALFVVPAGGSEPRPLLEPDAARGELGFWWPRALPEGGLLFTVGSVDPEVRGLWVTTLAAPGERERLLPDDARAVFASGRLLYARAGDLLARPFDAARRRWNGEAAVLSEGVESFPGRANWGWFDASANGVLAQLVPARDDVQLAWLDRAGFTVEEFGPPGAYGQVSLSPGGDRVAVTMPGPEGVDAWVMDVASGLMLRATSDPGDEEFVAWSPDGDELVYTSRRDPYAPPELRRQRLGTDEASVAWLATATEVHQWLPGRMLGVREGSIWSIPVDDPEDARRLLGETVTCNEPRVSPDGRWITYIVNESEHEDMLGDWQLYVAPTDRPANRTRVSVGGGYQPCWREDSRELVYIRRDGWLMAAAIRDEGGRPVADPPTPLFEITFTRPTKKQFQIRGDGERILMKVPAEKGEHEAVQVTLNWPALLR